MYSPLADEIYAVAGLAGPVEDCRTCHAVAPVSTLPASCLLEPPPSVSLRWSAVEKSISLTTVSS